MISIGEWLSDEIDNGFDVTRIPPFYIDTETLKECCLSLDEVLLDASLGVPNKLGISPNMLEKLGIHVVMKILGYSSVSEMRNYYLRHTNTIQ